MRKVLTKLKLYSNIETWENLQWNFGIQTNCTKNIK